MEVGVQWVKVALLWKSWVTIELGLGILPVLPRPEVVDIGVNTIYKNMPYA